MSNQRNQVLEVTNVSEETEAKDGRMYKVITVQKPSTGGVISTTRGHKKVIFSAQPMGGDKNKYYDAITKERAEDNGVKIAGRIETVDTEPYFIESESGKFEHPESKNPANKATQKTYVLFEDESVDSLLRNDGLAKRGEGDEQEQPYTESETLVAEDLGEEAEEVEVS